MARGLRIAFAAAPSYVLDALRGEFGYSGRDATFTYTPATPALTFAAADTGTVNVAASGSIQNTSSVSASWSITPPANITVTPSSGTLAAGQTQTLSITASAVGSYTLTLVSSGTTITGNPQTFVASSAAATIATLSGSTSGTTGSPTTFTVTLNGPVPIGGGTVSISAPGATLSTSTLTFTFGGATSQTFTVTRTTDGTSSVSITNSMGLTNAGTPISHTTTAAGVIVTNRITSSAGGTVGWAHGQPFRQGDLPSGVSLASVQTSVLSTWPDGSARFAIVAGHGTFSAGVATDVVLQPGTPASGPTLTTSDLQARMSDPVVFGTSAFGSASFSGSDWLSPFAQVCTGPEMSSWVYRKPIGADAHLVAWLEIRLFAGGAVEVLPWIENGYLLVASPTNKSATYTFSLGGSQRYTGTINLLSRQRTPLLSGSDLSHWLGVNPGVTALHNVQYLKDSRAWLDMQGTTPAGHSSVTGLPANYTPLQQGGYPTGMGSGGYHPSIGPLPEWDVLYVTANASDRAAVWAGIQRNAYSAGRYGIHFRDENTNRPIRFSQWPNLVTGGGTGISGTGNSTIGQEPVSPTGGAAPTYASTHAPAMGYAAYVLTGRFFHLETLQFQATANYLKNPDSASGRNGSDGIFKTTAGANTTRGVGWAWRTLAQAAAFTPDADPLKAEFVASYNANVNWYHARYVYQDHCPQGFVEPYSDYSPPVTGNATLSGSTASVVKLPSGANLFSDGRYATEAWQLVIGGEVRTVTSNPVGTFDFGVSTPFTVPVVGVPWIVREDNQLIEAIWMQDFVTFAMEYGPLLEINADAAQRTKELQLAHWKARSVIGRFGRPATADHYNYRDAAQYTLTVAPQDTVDWASGTGPWFATWGALQAAHEAERGSFGVDEDGPLRGGNFPDVTSYWGNLMPALALAVELGVAGAVEAWRRLTEASNYSTLAANFNGSPVWGVQPYGGYSRPAWVTSLPLWTWYEIPNTALANTPPSIAVTPGDPASKMHGWCGATVRIKGSHYMLGAAGGHADYAGNEVNSLKLYQAVPAWSELTAPTPTAQVYTGVAFYADLRPAAAHTYWMTQYLNTQDRMFIGPRGGLSYPQYPNAPGGFGYTGDGWPKGWAWKTKQWEAPGFFPQNTAAGSTDHALCFKHPYTDHVYVSPSYDAAFGCQRHHSVRKDWVKVSSASASPWYAGSICDPTRNRVLTFGGFVETINPAYRDLNLNGVTSTFTGLGPSGLHVGNYPGGDYDEFNDLFVVGANKDGVVEIRTCTASNPAALVVADPGMGGTKPSNRPNGIQNALRYVPELGGFVLANNYNQNVKFFRTS